MAEIKSLAGMGLEMAQNDNKKENLRKGLMIAGGVALAGVSIFAAMRGKKIANLQKELGSKNSEITKLGKQLKGLEDEMAQLKLGGLIGENKAGLKVYKFIEPEGKEVLTTIDGKTGEVVKRITKQKNPDKTPWLEYIQRGKDWYSLRSIESYKSTIVHIDDLKAGESIYKVQSNWVEGAGTIKKWHTESIKIQEDKITEVFSYYGDNWNSGRRSVTAKGLPGMKVVHKQPFLTSASYREFVDKTLRLYNKYILDLVEKFKAPELESRFYHG